MMPGGADVAELERRIAALSGKEAAVAEERRRLRVRARSLHNELYPPCFGLGDAITRCLAGGSSDGDGSGGGSGSGGGRSRRVLPRLPHVQCGLPGHWSDTPIDGALASFVPAKPVPRFKYTQMRRTECARHDMKASASTSYAYFLKTAANLGGTFRCAPSSSSCRSRCTQRRRPRGEEGPGRRVPPSAASKTTCCPRSRPTSTSGRWRRVSSCRPPSASAPACARRRRRHRQRPVGAAARAPARTAPPSPFVSGARCRRERGAGACWVCVRVSG